MCYYDGHAQVIQLLDRKIRDETPLNPHERHHMQIAISAGGDSYPGLILPFVISEVGDQQYASKRSRALTWN